MTATATATRRWVYTFMEGDSQRRDLLGGKGAGLADMAQAWDPERRVAVCRELTKPYEEVLRGTVGELSQQVADILGEITLVVAGADRSAPDLEELVEQVADLVERGMRRSEAVAQVAAESGVSRRELYALAVDR